MLILVMGKLYVNLNQRPRYRVHTPGALRFFKNITNNCERSKRLPDRWFLNHI